MASLVVQLRSHHLCSNIGWEA
jgi:hypothetical protein